MSWFYDLFFGKSEAKKLAKARKGMVNVAALNARKRASVKGKILYQLKKHDVVTILDESNGWYNIQTEKGKAYCMKQFIDIMDVIKKVIVNAKVLNVRSYHSTSATVIGKITDGSIYVVTSEQPEWFGINYNGKVGYVSSQYVTLITDKIEDSSSSKDTTPAKKEEKKEEKKTTPVVNQDKKFFNQRADLLKVELKPKKQLSTDGLATKEKIAATTWNNYGNLISVIAKELGIDVESAMAVLCVESGGKGFASDNKMIIRFENHVFYTYWGKKTDDQKKEFDKYFTFNPNKTRDDHKYRRKASDDWTIGHNGQNTEWEAFGIARSLAEKEAMYSISMGAPQVMGFNYKMIGYESVQDMFNSFSKDIRYHFFALFDFCNAKSSRVQYLATRDFLSFAKEYNGLAAPQQYEKRIVEYYDIIKKLLK